MGSPTITAKVSFSRNLRMARTGPAGRRMEGLGNKNKVSPIITGFPGFFHNAGKKNRQITLPTVPPRVEERRAYIIIEALVAGGGGFRARWRSWLFSRSSAVNDAAPR